MAVKVIDAPAQAVVGLAVTETLGTNKDVTVIGMAFEVAGDPVKHGVALEVI